MATMEELRSFTVEKLRELCAEKHICITARKEELIAALTEAREAEQEVKTPKAGSVSTGPSSAELCDMILTIQRQQMLWMENSARSTARDDGEDEGAAGERTLSS